MDELERVRRDLQALIDELRKCAQQPGNGDYYVGLQSGYERSADELQRFLDGIM